MGVIDTGYVGELSLSGNATSDAASVLQTAADASGSEALSTAADVATDAAEGATAGSVVPGWGTAIGAAGGAIYGALKHIFGKTQCYDFYGADAPSCDQIDNYVTQQAYDFAMGVFSKLLETNEPSEDMYRAVHDAVASGTQITRPLDDPQQRMLFSRSDWPQNMTDVLNRLGDPRATSYARNLAGTSTDQIGRQSIAHVILAPQNDPRLALGVARAEASAAQAAAGRAVLLPSAQSAKPVAKAAMRAVSTTTKTVLAGAGVLATIGSAIAAIRMLRGRA